MLDVYFNDVSVANNNELDGNSEWIHIFQIGVLWIRQLPLKELQT